MLVKIDSLSRCAVVSKLLSNYPFFLSLSFIRKIDNKRQFLIKTFVIPSTVGIIDINSFRFAGVIYSIYSYYFDNLRKTRTTGHDWPILLVST